MSSNRILIRTISDYLEGREAQAPDFTLADHVTTQAEWLASPDCAKKLALFAEMYARHAEAIRAADPLHGEKAPAAHLPAVHCEMLSADITQRATRRARETGVTLVLFFKGIAGMMLSCVSGHAAHFSSVIFAGRHLRGSESIVGHLGSHLPVFHDLATPASIHAYLLGLSRQWLFNTWHFGAIPIGMLEKAAGGSDADFRRHGLFNRAMLNFLPLPQMSTTFAHLPWAMIPEQRAMYLTTQDAQIIFRLAGDCVQVTLKCPAHEPERLTALRWALHRCLAAAIDTPLLAPAALLRAAQHRQRAP